MPKKTTDTLENKTYEELEKMSEEIMEKLSKEDLGLDESSRLYQEGKTVLEEMERRLEKLSKEVSDHVESAD